MEIFMPIINNIGWILFMIVSSLGMTLLVLAYLRIPIWEVFHYVEELQHPAIGMFVLIVVLVHTLLAGLFVQSPSESGEGFFASLIWFVPILVCAFVMLIPLYGTLMYRAHKTKSSVRDYLCRELIDQNNISLACIIDAWYALAILAPAFAILSR